MDHPAGGTEKRNRKRYKLVHEVGIQLDGRLVAGRTLDFSTRGFCVITAPNFPAANDFALVFSLNSPGDWVFPVTVANRSEVVFQGQKVARLGLRIVEFKSNPAPFFEYMVQLVKQKRAAKPVVQPTEQVSVPSGQTTGMTEQITGVTADDGDATKRENRTDKRYSFTAAAKVRIGSKVFSAKVHDISVRGIGVYAPMEVTVSDQLKVTVFLDDGGRFMVDAVERERQVVERPDGIGLRLGLRIVRSDDAFKQTFNRVRDDAEHDKTLRQTGGHEHTTGTEVVGAERDIAVAARGLIGKVKYQYLKRLGKGGFAEVYLVRDMALNRDIAMKVLSPKFSREAKLSARFIAEAQIAAQFEHPHIATVYEVGEIGPSQYAEKLDFPAEILKPYGDRLVYFTMQYIQGHSIAQFIKNEGKIDSKRTLKWISAVARALAYAHEKGVVHRDIKPENIMVTLDKHVLVTDFGIAKILARQESDDPEVEASAEQDKTRGFMGTPIYASPEQVVAEGIDGRSDIYSLGVMGYEMLCGQPPFRGERWVETIAMHLHKVPESLIERDAQISQNVSDLIMKCLEKTKEKRYQSAGEFATSVEKVYQFLERGDIEVEAQASFDQDSIDLVKHLFVQFGKAYRTIGTYPETHDLVKLATTELFVRFERFFEKHERLDIRVESMRLMFLHESIWEEDQKENAFCFNLFRDGIRKLLFFRGMPREEIEVFMLRLFRFVNDLKNYEEDSVTILFQSGFQFIDFEYVDSFYEDEASLSRIKKIQDNWVLRQPWKLEEAVRHTIPIAEALQAGKQIDKSSTNLPIHKLVHYLTKEVYHSVRLKAIQIILNHLRHEETIEVFERHFAVLEDVVYSCLTENDLQTVREIFVFLELWAREIPESDPREMQKRLLRLKERLSEEQFLNELIDKYFTVDRSLKDAIFSLCEFLLPTIAVKVLFNRFSIESEEWRKIFLSELAVMASGATLTPLVRMSMGLNDQQAAIMLNGFARSPERLSKSVLEAWLKHPGSQTRQRVARLIASARKPEFMDLMVRIASDRKPAFSESRRYAWKYIAKVARPKLAKIITGFMDAKVFPILADEERRTILDFAGQIASPSAIEFLSHVLHDQGALGQGSSSMDDRKAAAVVLVAKGGPQGRKSVEKMAKKLLGNRELISHCKSTLEAAS